MTTDCADLSSAQPPLQQDVCVTQTVLSLDEQSLQTESPVLPLAAPLALHLQLALVVFAPLPQAFSRNFSDQLAK